jgi:hypothetical protein
MPKGRFKRFGKERYYRVSEGLTKTEAKSKAKWYRGRGYNARVIKEGTSYSVYATPK